MTYLSEMLNRLRPLMQNCSAAGGLRPGHKKSQVLPRNGARGRCNSKGNQCTVLLCWNTLDANWRCSDFYRRLLVMAA